MDLVTVGVFILSFAVCAVLVFAVSVIGAKEQTFEEALAEQKRKKEAEKSARSKPGKAVPAVSGSSPPTAKEPSASKKAKQKPAAASSNSVEKKKKGDVTDEDDLVFPAKEPTAAAVTPVLHEVPTPEPTPEPPTVNAAKKSKVPAEAKKKKMVIEEVEAPVNTKEIAVSPVGAEKLTVAKQASVEIEPEPVKVAKAELQQTYTSSNKKKKEKDVQVQTQHTAGSTLGKMTGAELISVVKRTPLDESDAQQLIEVLLNKSSSSTSSSSAGWQSKGSGKSQEAELKRVTEELEQERERYKSTLDRMGQLRQELNGVKAAATTATRARDEAAAKLGHEVNALTARLQSAHEVHQRDTAALQQQVQLHVQAGVTLQATIVQLEEQRNQLIIQAQQMQQAPITDPNEHAELGQLRDRVEVLQQQLSSSSQQSAEARSELERRLQEKIKVEAALEAKVAKVTGDLKRVSDDNASLSERLAASEKRALAYSQEEAKRQQQPNGGHENGSFKHEEVVAGWENKYKAAVEEKEQISKESESQVSKLQSEVMAHQCQIKQVQAELDEQRAKNDELSSSVLKTREEQERTERALLQRLFPHVSAEAKAAKGHEAWIEDFASKIKATSVSDASSGTSDQDKDRMELLEKKVAEYKVVLADTEGMLRNLQSTVETEESKWKQRLSDKDGELSAAVKERDDLRKANATLKESMAILKQAEEMQSKLEELQAKLSEEESERRDITARLAEANAKIAEKDRLEQDLLTARGELDQERRRKEELSAKLAHMSHTLSSSQEALRMEQKNVELLKDGSATSETKASAENGPKAENEATAAQ